jgi:hypothetical protein
MSTQAPSAGQKLPTKTLFFYGLADVPVMMFRNRAHGGLNMVYRRTDGNIGWIDPRGNRGT